jgi:hypothetical protein
MDEKDREFNNPKTFMDNIREVDEKYRTPRAKMSPAVRLSLLALTLYLIFMFLLLIYKFVSTIIH